MFISSDFLHPNCFSHFREYRNKYFNESNLLEEGKVLEYTQLKTFHFSPETSQENASESDTICTLNIPLVVRESNHEMCN